MNNPLRDLISYVPQKGYLFSGTVESNVKFNNPKLNDDEMKQALEVACAKDFVEEKRKKYKYEIAQGGTNVSGGQRQRLCIASSILKNPNILILDDSTSAVDTRTDKLIQEAFKKNIPNTTKIVIAQRISSVEQADKIIVLDNGKINGIGTHKELLKKNEIYKEVYESQMKGSDSNE